MCEVSSENGTLLKPSERTFQIPRGKGFPGQSNVWYENDKNTEVTRFKRKLRNLISNGKITKRKRVNMGTRSKRPNKIEILAIERAAVEKAWGKWGHIPYFRT